MAKAPVTKINTPMQAKVDRVKAMLPLTPNGKAVDLNHERPKPKLVPKPKVPPKQGGTLKTDNRVGGPDEGYGGQDAEARRRNGMLDAENDRKDAEWEKGQLDKAVRDSPSVDAFLQKMRGTARDQAREKERLQASEDELRKKPRAGQRPPFNSPLPPYHTPPDPSAKQPGRRSEPRDEYHSDRGQGKNGHNSKPIPAPPTRKKLPPTGRMQGSPPFIPARKPSGTPPLKAPPRDQKPPVIPPMKRPQGTPPFKGGEAGILRFVTRKPRR